MCGIFGVIRKKNTELGEKAFKHLVRNLGIASQVRGTDATGIAFNYGGALNIHKADTPAASFPFIQLIPNGTKAVIGHTRLTTQGSEKFLWNNHPFEGRTRNRGFAMAHNGMFWNDTWLKHSFDLPKTKIETDSYVAVQLIEKMGKLNARTLKSMAEELEGTFVLTFLEEKTNDLWLVKGDNPITILDFPELGFIAYASTDSILLNAIKSNKMLYMYYKAAVDNEDVTRVKEVHMLDGDILHYDYSRNKWNRHKFDTSLLFYNRYTYNYNYGYGYRYSGGGATKSKNYTVDKDGTILLLPGDSKDNEKKDVTDTKEDFNRTSREDYGSWEVVYGPFSDEEILVYYDLDGSVDIVDMEGKHYVFNNYADAKAFIEIFEDFGASEADTYVQNKIKAEKQLNKVLR